MSPKGKSNTPAREQMPLFTDHSESRYANAESPISAKRSKSPGPNRAETPSFASRVIAWQRQFGRHDLPWQNTRDPYRIWLSEIMLQQTQVTAVIPYYLRFLRRFASLQALAEATQDEVLAHWSGLGYYARGRNLHRAAQQVYERHNGVFPADFDRVAALPGIGRSTAAAICVFAFGARHAILDGNVKRVLARHEAIAGYPGEKPVQDLLWSRAAALMPDADVEAYTQGLMDLGSEICVRRTPRCNQCPVAQTCIARREHRIAELPAPRPAKTLPQRETRFVVMLDHGEVLLEKRPAAGVWGGMWCFPEAAVKNVASCAALFAADFEDGQALTPIEHGFTHYRLRIHPMLVRVKQRAPRITEPKVAWVQIQAALRYAIPTPVRGLLERLSDFDQ